MPTALNITLDGQVHELTPDRTWQLAQVSGRLVLDGVAGDDHTGGRVLGAFHFLGQWVFDALPTAIGVLEMDGRPLADDIAHLDGQSTVDFSLYGPPGGASAPTPPSAPSPVASPAATLVIGRTGGAADIVVDDPTVAVSHATAQLQPDGTWMVARRDGQVWINQRSAMFALLAPGDRFTTGQTTFVVQPGGAPPVVVGAATARRGARIRAGAYSGAYAGDSPLPALDRVSLDIAPNDFVAVVGPSGAGKSSLLKALLGGLKHRGGSLSIDGVEVGGDHYRNLLQRLVRYVPQSDDLYGDLTVRETLQCGARIRLADDTTAAERQARIATVVDQLQLGPKVDSLVKELSGGQRRRASIALELVANPRLLLLDEPTSGLDQGKDRQVMQALQRIASDGCTVICVSHAVDHLVLANKLIVVAGKGQIAYAGPSDEALDALGQVSWADLMDDLERNPEHYGGSYRHEHPAAVSSQITQPARASTDLGEPLAGLGTLIRRQTRLVGRRGVTSLLALAAIPAVGTLVAVLAARHGLSLLPVGQPGQKPPAQGAGQVLGIAATVAALGGTSLTYGDVVTELATLKRDWRVGVPSRSIILAKTVVFGVMSLLLASIMVGLFVALRGLPPGGLHGIPALVAVAVPWASVSFASMCLGLLLSARARTLERAVTFATGAAIFQVVLNGTLFRLTGGLATLSLVVPARLGLAAGAAWLSFNRIRVGIYHDDMWRHDAVHFLVPLIGLAVLSCAFVAAAIRQLDSRFRQSE